jgi:protein TonB
MAPQAKLADTAPTTLPDDFDAWDGGEQPPATLPDDFDEFDSAPTPPVKSAATPVAVVPPALNRADVPTYRAPAAPTLVPAASPVVKRTQEIPVLRTPAAAPKASAAAPRVSVAAPKASVAAPRVSVAAPKASVASPAVNRVAEQPATQSSKYATTAELSSLVRAYHATRDAEPEDNDLRKKKIMMISIGAGVLVLVILVVMYFTMFRKSSEKKPVVVVQQPTVSYTPDAPTPQQQGKPNPSTPVQATPDTSDQVAQTPSVKSEMMNAQLNAPARISKDVKGQEKDAAPPPASFGTGGLEGLGGASAGGVAGVFGKQVGPKVGIETPKVVSISSGVAQGMLIIHRPPVYPAIAKTARVSGTVVMQATISKTGTIDNLRVVSGPQLLRQSAVDAVRNWRYKPYMLNNEPVEVESTVSVVFSLGG